MEGTLATALEDATPGVAPVAWSPLRNTPIHLWLVAGLGELPLATSLELKVGSVVKLQYQVHCPAGDSIAAPVFLLCDETGSRIVARVESMINEPRSTAESHRTAPQTSDLKVVHMLNPDEGTLSRATSKDSLDLMDVPLSLQIEVGRVELTVGELLELKEGAIVKPQEAPTSVVRLRSGTRVVAHGELIEHEGSLGVRLTHINASP